MRREESVLMIYNLVSINLCNYGKVIRKGKKTPFNKYNNKYVSNVFDLPTNNPEFDPFRVTPATTLICIGHFNSRYLSTLRVACPHFYFLTTPSR